MKIYLNLLPGEKKKQLHSNKVFRITLKQELLFLLPLLMLIVMFACVNFILKMQKDSVVIQNSQTKSGGKYQELDDYEKKFKSTNELSVKLLKIQKNHLRWSNMLDEFSRLVPDGVKIGNLATKNYKVMISGSASTREKLLAFKDNLDGSSCIIDVNIPLSNMVQRENVEFQLDFSLKEECLKKQK